MLLSCCPRPPSFLDLAPSRLADLAMHAEKAGADMGVPMGVVHTWHQFATGSWSAFVLMRKAVEEVGLFDENFFPAYKEDQASF